jgi:phosphatidylserine/phosphatidylglycerophosphate/cardiolipin synthase-like enzyme
MQKSTSSKNAQTRKQNESPHENDSIRSFLNFIELKSFFAGVVFCLVLIFVLFFSIYSNSFVEAQAVFSPNSQSEVISLIHQAQNSIDLQMYVFTNEQIAVELIDASKRGVKVRVILEKRTQSYNLDEIVDALKQGGVEVCWASEKYKLTHTKMMIIDDKTVFVGSTNFSKSALLENREASVILQGNIVKEFIDVFQTDWELADKV